MLLMKFEFESARSWSTARNIGGRRSLFSRAPLRFWSPAEIGDAARSRSSGGSLEVVAFRASTPAAEPKHYDLASPPLADSRRRALYPLG